MIRIRKARPADAAAIAAIHVETWRGTYPGLLPEAYLAGLSLPRIAASYQRGLLERREGSAMFVAIAEPELGGGPPQVVGFASGARARRPALAQGEIETLYLLEDWRERGVGRRLMRATAAHLAAIGCRSAMLWVLSGNPARWFYQHLGGRLVGTGMVRVGGVSVPQSALLWDPIQTLLLSTARADGA